MKHLIIPVILFFALFSGSCVKNTPAALDIGIDSVAAIYVNFDDTSDVPVLVRFLSGNDREQVSVTIAGLPSKVKLLTDTIYGFPTFTAQFRMAVDSAPVGLYPIQIITNSKSRGYRVYNLNLGIIKNTCATVLEGSYNAANTCKRVDYRYTVDVQALTGSTAKIVNLGGYGSATAAIMKFDCYTNTITIDEQSIGNGVTLKGNGTFSENSMSIYYTAKNTPGGYNDTCTAVLTR